MKGVPAPRHTACSPSQDGTDIGTELVWLAAFHPHLQCRSYSGVGHPSDHRCPPTWHHRHRQSGLASCAEATLVTFWRWPGFTIFGQSPSAISAIDLTSSKPCATSASAYSSHALDGSSHFSKRKACTTPLRSSSELERERLALDGVSAARALARTAPVEPLACLPKTLAPRLSKARRCLGSTHSTRPLCWWTALTSPHLWHAQA